MIAFANRLIVYKVEIASLTGATDYK